MEFEWPVFIGLLPLPLFVYFLAPPFIAPSEAVRTPFLDLILKRTGSQQSIPEMNAGKKLVLVICWCLLITAAADPRKTLPPEIIEQPARDIVLILDVSGSMETRDFQNAQGPLQTRLEAATDVISGFIKQRPDDRIGLVVFGSGAFPVAPPSMDHKALVNLVMNVQAGVAGEQTALGDAIGVAIRLFEGSPAQDKLAILLTDGSDTASTLPPARAAQIAADKSVQIHTIAIGNEDSNPPIDTTSLKNIAQTTGGEFFTGQDTVRLAKIYEQIDRMTPHQVTQLSLSKYQPLFMWPLLFMLVLLFTLLVLESFLLFRPFQKSSSKQNTLVSTGAK
ncbi:hypothetical protein ACH42_06225 [Endozoicomonas sp. (ex Bugula neritina AB1)]|nr:hypothetical protein ACH42_06225 [Endozoicomonas sp. (ex Bugula neritina AB1)]